MLACLISRTAGEARIGGHRVGDPAAARKLRSLDRPDAGGGRAVPGPERGPDAGLLRPALPGPRPLRAERTERLLTLLGLWDRRDARVRTFSKGMQQRLALARALIHDPPVLFLDEPTANLDPEGAKTVRDFLIELSDDKRTILLNTHQLAEAERVCDRVGILANRLIAVGITGRAARSGRRQHHRRAAGGGDRAGQGGGADAGSGTSRSPATAHRRGRRARARQPGTGPGDRRGGRRGPVRHRVGALPRRDLPEPDRREHGNEPAPENVATITADELAVRGDASQRRTFPHPAATGRGLHRPAAGWHLFAQTSRTPPGLLPRSLNAFLFFFAVIAEMLPVAIASYSLVGEKVERSLEPLLATPATDGEILLGKGLAASPPADRGHLDRGRGRSWSCATQDTRARLGYLYFPNGTAILILVVFVPLMAILSVESACSSRRGPVTSGRHSRRASSSCCRR